MDIAPFLDRPTAIVGTTGAGKTFTAKGAVEQLLALGRRVIILDPTGAWWGLRSGADGDEEGGFPVTIFGGDHADVPIEPTAEAGKTLALALAERDVQAIIDTSEMTGGEKNRFLTPFLENLYAKNKAALHLIVDEADEVAAQKLADGEQRLFGAFDKIVRRGRIKGFRPLMISQRPAVIHKNVLSQIGTLIAMKLTSPQDRAAIQDWVKGNADADAARQVITSLPKLQRGEGWVWSPADDVLERVTFPPIATFDSSRTPEDGEAAVAPALTPVDVDALREAMKAPAEAESASSEPRASSKVEIEAAEKRGYERGSTALSASYRRKLEAVESASAAVFDAVAALRSATQRALWDDAIAGSPSGKAADFDSATAGSSPAPATNPEPVERVKRPVASTPKSKASAPAVAGDPFLDVAHRVWPAKLSWAGLAAACGRKARGGSFNTRRRALIDGGHVREEGDLVVPINPPASPEGVSPADLLEQNLPSASADAFKMIRRQPGISIDALAAQLGVVPRGGSWNTRMSILRKNGLITQQGGLRIAAGLE
jgi:hypothetical protein